MKILTAGVEVFHEDGQAGGRTYMTKLMVTFNSFSMIASKTEGDLE
jgi:hypothetical protein